MPRRAPMPAASGAGNDRLLDRNDELEVLDGVLQDGLAGEAVLAVVEGPAGIGKSRLLARARDQATAARYRVLQARGGALEREYSFGVVRQLFEPLLADGEQRDRWLAGAAAPAARVFAPPDDSAHTGDVSYGILHGLFRLTANIAADGPLLLAVDDLHWCDRASLRFVVYLAPRLDGIPVVLITGLRSGELPAEASLLDEITNRPGTIAVRPQPLSDVASADLVRSQLGA